MAELLTFPSLPTFRDPAGSCRGPSGRCCIAVCALLFDAEILDFLALPLAEELVAQGRLVASEVVTPAGAETLVLRHPRISFQSYPVGVGSSLWLAAAELTLDLCSDLVQQGWLLKDATPLNVSLPRHAAHLCRCALHRTDGPSSTDLACVWAVRSYLPVTDARLLPAGLAAAGVDCAT